MSNGSTRVSPDDHKKYFMDHLEGPEDDYVPEQEGPEPPYIPNIEGNVQENIEEETSSEDTPIAS